MAFTRRKTEGSSALFLRPVQKPAISQLIDQAHRATGLFDQQSFGSLPPAIFLGQLGNLTGHPL